MKIHPLDAALHASINGHQDVSENILREQPHTTTVIWSVTIIQCDQASSPVSGNYVQPEPLAKLRGER